MAPPLILRPAVTSRAQYQAELECCTDARTGMPCGIPQGAMCVQRFDDSLNSAIHITYRISLRSSSMPEPRDPLLKVLTIIYSTQTTLINRVWGPLASTHQRKAGGRGGSPKQQRFNNIRVGESPVRAMFSVMIPPQVHLRRPCYDFYFL